MAAKKNAAKMTVFFEENGPPREYALESVAGWSIFAEDVLEINVANGPAVYIPLHNLHHWQVEPVSK